MTEYTTSSQAIREYMSSRERTAYWVETNGDMNFLSPSAPPSVLDEWAPSSPGSEVESSHSEPPHMVLRYGNGVEVPIQNSADSSSGVGSSRSRHRRSDSRSRSSSSPISSRLTSSRHRAMSGPHPSSPLAHSGPYGMLNQAPQTPEEIRVLPSAEPRPSSSNSNQPRAKSLPRSAEHPIRYDPVPGLSTNPRIRTPYPGATSPTTRGPLPALNHLASQTTPWHSYSQARAPPHLHKQPPAIIYAPSNTTSRPHYTPPAIYHYPPQMGPNGMAYSHSAPVGSQYPRSTQPPVTALPPSYAFARPREDQRGATWNGHSNTWGYHDRSRSLPVVPPLSRSSSSDSLESEDSGSTYYVLPSAGQKIHVLPPSPRMSIGTATSTTRSANSPHSLNKKTNLFQRLFSFAGRFSGGENGRIERRHSMSGVDRRRPSLTRR